MKFLYAKKNMTCAYSECRSTIHQGELYIRTHYKDKEKKFWRSFPYHYECYIKYITEQIRRSALFWMDKIKKPKKQGRPKKYIDPKEADRLRALIYYNRKHGKDTKDLEERMEGLKLDGNKTGNHTGRGGSQGGTAECIVSTS